MTGGRATCVGRGYELALLKDSLAADAGRSWIVLAEGEPGMGRRRCCARVLAAGRFTGRISVEREGEQMNE